MQEKMYLLKQKYKKYIVTSIYNPVYYKFEIKARLGDYMHNDPN